MPLPDIYNRNDSVPSSQSFRGMGGNHPRRNGSGGGRRNSRQPGNLNSLPFEQGIICSLKESFGFIHCAERPEEIFFHYSEVTNCHPDDLRIDTEVEFKVGAPSGGGSSDRQKHAAFSVATLPPGTVVWETEEHEGRFYEGLVEKPCGFSSGRGGGSTGGGPQADGTIRLVVGEEDAEKAGTNEVDGEAEAEAGETSEGATELNENNNEDGDVEGKKKKNKKKQKQKPNGKSGPVVRLRTGEYTGAGESGGGGGSNRLYRGDMVAFRVFLDKRTKQKYARQITLLQSARERKRLQKEKLLLEKATKEEGIVVSLNNGFGFLRSNKRREDVYFHYSHLVIPEVEEGGENDEFELVKGQEVRFLVVTEEQQERQNSGSKSSRDNNSVKISARQIHCLPKGSVVFQTLEQEGVKGVVARAPQPPSPGSKGDDSRMGFCRVEGLAGDVLLHHSDVPGGVFTYQNHRNSTAAGLWIQEGDTLLFDVVKEVVDGSYRAVPTKHRIGLGGSILAPSNAEEDDAEGAAATPAIRLVDLSMVGRAEGVVHTMKNDYGFIHFAERPVDVHFKTYDLLPDELQEDVRRAMGIDEPIRLREDTAVRFDICAHGNITATANRGRRRGGGQQQQARENIRGQRILLLPRSEVTLEKVLATGCKGSIRSVNPQQPYIGVLDLEPLSEEQGGALKPMSMEERHPLVAKMIDSFLEESSLPNGKKSIVFRDTLGMNDDDVVTEMAKLKGAGVLECSHIPVPGLAPHPGRICIRRVERSEENNSESEDAENQNSKSPKESAKGKKKGKQSPIERSLKNLRFEKSSLDEAFREDVPPSPGDIVECDVVQYRRTGKIAVRNLKIVERATTEAPSATVSSGVGVVKDVVPRRNFGFISLLDENNTKNEILFFHLSKDNQLVKGSEVRFDIAMEGTKRTAINVESVPKGTIPSTASKNACMGYILMEPSHTTLKNTPARKTAKASGDKVATGRWAEANDDAKTTVVKQDMVEDGCILLLEDKTGMFQKKRTRRRKKRSKSIDSTDSMGDVSIDEAKSGESVDGVADEDDGLSSDDGDREDDGTVSILSRLSYTNGSIAIHGAGASSSMDGSTNPKRGDLVSFVKGRKRKTVRDIRIVKRETALLQRGTLENIEITKTEDNSNKGTARFVAATEKQEVYDVDLAEVVSCSVALLKEKTSVEGILHEGKIYGLCRTSDLYLTSKLVVGSGKNRQRPKLNLTVKKDRGGTIMAQSMMAKGPDDTIGFKPGWTTRQSQYTVIDSDESDEEVKNGEEEQNDPVQSDQKDETEVEEETNDGDGSEAKAEGIDEGGE
ncbi:unnamed protein product [Pseudo-nitzschia multistriata]|uniref:CSD domain-containing protein n=1 Tax=Pseudo-nitzschia multistriata TaxID=183589 RepID=A0A448Z5X1_9STRA|nr:unnamed protein product [Pseudo-nitzschia multistriata]